MAKELFSERTPIGVALKYKYIHTELGDMN